jgi:hypothetical protein
MTPSSTTTETKTKRARTAAAADDDCSPCPLNAPKRLKQAQPLPTTSTWPTLALPSSLAPSLGQSGSLADTPTPIATPVTITLQSPAFVTYHGAVLEHVHNPYPTSDARALEASVELDWSAEHPAVRASTPAPAYAHTSERIFTPAPTPTPSRPAAGQRKKRGDPNKARRPPNMFILYRSLNLHKFETGGRQSELSKMISAAWHNEPEHVKDYYAALAEREKEEHAKRNPGYAYKPAPSRRKNRKQPKSVRGVERAATSPAHSGSSSSPSGTAGSAPPDTVPSSVSYPCSIVQQQGLTHVVACRDVERSSFLTLLSTL